MSLLSVSTALYSTLHQQLLNDALRDANLAPDPTVPDSHADPAFLVNIGYTPPSAPQNYAGGAGPSGSGLTSLPQTVDQAYLADNTLAAAEVEAGIYKSGFDQWLQVGADEGLIYNGYTKAQAESAYVGANPDVATALANNGWDTALHEFINHGAGLGRSFAGLTSANEPIQSAEQAYLSANLGAAAEVQAGLYRSGFDQWLHEGAYQGLAYNGYDKETAEAAYAAQYAGGTLAEYVSEGAGLGRSFAGQYASGAPVQSQVFGFDVAGANLLIDKANDANAFIMDATLTGASLTNDTLTGSSLSTNDLTNATISGSNLANGYLSSSKLTNTVISNNTATGAFWYSDTMSGAAVTGNDLTNATLYNSTVNGSTFANDTLKGYSFSSDTLNGLTVTGSNLASAFINSDSATGLAFTGDTLTGASIIFDTLQGSTFTNDDLTNVSFTGTDLGASTITGSTLTGATFSLSGTQLQSASISGSTLAGDSLYSLNMKGATLANDDLTKLSVSGDSLAGASLTGDTLVSASISGSDLTNATLASDNMNLASITNSTLAGATLSGDTLTSAYLSGNTFGNATLSGSNLAGTSIYSSTLAGTVLTNDSASSSFFSGDTLTGASITGSDLSKASISGGSLSNSLLASDSLGGLWLNGATLTADSITGSDLTKASLGGTITGSLFANDAMGSATISSATLTNSTISGSNLAGAFLSSDKGNISFTNDTLTGASIIFDTLQGATFASDDLTNVSFTGSDLTNSTISGSTLTGATFIALAGTQLQGASISGSNLAGDSFNNLKMSNATFANDSLAGASLTGDTLTGATFASDDLTKASFNGSNLGNATITGSNLSGATFATLSGSQMQGASVSGSNLAGDTLTKLNIANAVFANDSLASAVLTSDTLTGSTFANDDLTKASFNGSNLANATISGSTLTGATFTTLSGSQMLGVSISGSNLAGDTLTKLNIANASFANDSLGSAILTSDTLTGTRFSNDDLTKASFNGSDLGNATITGSTLTGATFTTLSGSQMLGVSISGSNLAGDTLTKLNVANAVFANDSLGSAVLTSDTLTGARFDNDDLTKANFNGSNLAGATVTGSNLTGATFTTLSGSQMLGVSISGSNLAGDTLTKLNIANASFANDSLAGAVLTNDTLTGTRFTSDNLTGANFTGSNLAGDTITGSTLTGANFSSLSGSQLLGASITGSDLTGDTLTKLNIANSVFANDSLGNAILTSDSLTGASFTGDNLSGANFTGSDLGGDTITASTLTGANFTSLGGSQLLAASISGSDLTGDKLDKLNIANVTFANDSLAGAVLTNDTLTGAKFTGDDLGKASFAGSNLTGATIAGSNLVGASFAGLAGTQLQNASITGSNLAGDSFGALNLSAAALANDSLAGASFTGTNLAGDRLDGSTLTGASLTGVNAANLAMAGGTATGASISGSTLTGAALSGSNLANVTVSGSALDHASLSNDTLTGLTVAAGTSLQASTISGSDLTGAALTNSNLQGTTLQSDNLSNVSLAGSNLTGATIAGSTVTGVDFSSVAALANVSITGSNLAGDNFDKLSISGTLANDTLAGAHLTHDTLSGVVFSGDTLTGADLSASTLTGATMSGVSAANLSMTGAAAESLSVSGGSFAGATISGSDLAHDSVTGTALDGALLANDSLNAATIAGSSLQGATISGSALAGTKLTGDSLQGSSFAADDLTNADFTGSDLTGASITGSSLAGAHLAGLAGGQLQGASISFSTLAGDSLGAVNLGGASLANDTLSAVTLTDAKLGNATISGSTLTGAAFQGVAAGGLSIAGSSLENVTIGASTVTGAASNLAGATISGSDLAGASVSGANLDQAALTADSLAGATIAGASLRGASVTGSALAGAAIGTSDLTGAVLSGNSLAAASLAGDTLAGASFSNDDLTKASFAGSDLTGATIADSSVTGADFTAAKLHGATISGSALAGDTFGAIDVADATLSGDDLGKASFAGTNLTGDTISASNLQGATIAGAALTGAALQNDTLAGAQVTASHLDSATIGASDATGLTVSNSTLTSASLTGDTLAGASFSNDDLTKASFAGSDLSGATIAGSSVTGADFTGAKLHGATISGSALAGDTFGAIDAAAATLSGDDLGKASFAGTNLTGDTISASNLQGATIAGAALTGAALQNDSLAGAQVTASHLDSATISGGDATGLTVSNSTLTAASLTGDTLAGASFSNDDLTKASFAGSDLTGATIANSSVTGADFTGAKLHGATVSGSALAGDTFGAIDVAAATLSGDDLGKASFAGTNLTGDTISASNLQGATIAGAALTGAALQNDSLAGAQVTASHLDSATISASDATGLTVSGSTLTSASLTGDTLAGASFSNDDLTKASFAGSDLSGATIAGSSVTGADFTGTKLAGATISGSDATGATIADADLTGASLFADTLSGASITGVTASGLQVQDAELDGAAITGSDLTGATVKDSNLAGILLANDTLRGIDIDPTDFSGATVTGSDLTGSRFADDSLVGASFGNDTLSNTTITGGNLSGLVLSHSVADHLSLGNDTLTGAAISDTDLSGATITGSDLGHATLTNVSLHGAALAGIKLDAATLSGVDLVGADLSGADLSGVDLANVDLTGANLAGANLSNATISGGTLKNADLTGANLAGATIENSDLTGAHVQQAQLQGAHLSNTTLQNANLTQADLTSAVLANTDLSSSNLSNANATNASLSNVSLQDANVAGANFTNAAFDSVTAFDGATTAPDQAYLAANADAATEVQQRKYSSGFDQWVHEGGVQDPARTYNGVTLAEAEATYLQDNSDVAQTYGSLDAFQHFVANGKAEGRDFAGLTAQQMATRSPDLVYLAANQQAALEVAQNKYKNGLDQWVHEGGFAGLTYNGMTLAQAAQTYLTDNTDVAAQVGLGAGPDALAHFLQYGAAEGRIFAGYNGGDASTNPADLAYLAANPDAAAQVELGNYTSGFDQWVHEGGAAGHSYNGLSLQQAEQNYLHDNNDVATLVASETSNAALDHFVTYGLAEGRSFAGLSATTAPADADTLYLAQHADAAQAVAHGDYQTGFDQWLHQGAAAGYSYNGFSLQSAAASYLQSNSDVKADAAQLADADALQHFQAYGAAEGRSFAGLAGADPATNPIDATYLAQHATAATEVANGTYRTGFDQWVNEGAAQGFTYNGNTLKAAEEAYLAANSDVAASIAANSASAALQHFTSHGLAEGRSFAGFSTSSAPARDAETLYLAQNHAAAQEVAGGTYRTGFEQWLHEGAAQGLTYNGFTLQAAESAYLTANTDVAALGTSAANAFALQHFQTHGLAEGRSFAGLSGADPHTNSADLAYLAQHAAAAAEVESGAYHSGFDQWIWEGAAQGLTYNGYTLAAAEQAYLQANSDVAAQINATSATDALQQFVSFGRAEGRTFAGTSTAQGPTRNADLLYLAQNHTAAQEVANGQYQTGFDQWLREGAAQGLTYNGYTLASAESTYLATNSDVNTQLTNTADSNALQHFKSFGSGEGRIFAGVPGHVAYSSNAELRYLAQNATALSEVASGQYQNGFEQWVHEGAQQGWTYNGYTLQSAEDAYLAANSDVATSADFSSESGALQHYLQYGHGEGRGFAGTFANSVGRPAQSDLNYLQSNAQARAEIANGNYNSGFDQWIWEGGAQGYTYNGYSLQSAEVSYLQSNSDVAAQQNAIVAAGALQHFVQFGENEGRSFAGTAHFTLSANQSADVRYLSANSTAAAQVASGQYQTGFDQWIHQGATQGFGYNGYSLASAASTYYQTYSDLVSIADGKALQHFKDFGAADGRSFAGIFTATLGSVRAADITYLAQNATALNEIVQGHYATAFDQWAAEGGAQGATYNGYTLTGAEQAYLQANSDVAAQAGGVTASSALQHFIDHGAQEGRSFAGKQSFAPSAAQSAEAVYLAANATAASEVASGQYSTGYDQWLREGAAQGYGYNGNTLASAAATYYQTYSDLSSIADDAALQHFRQFGAGDGRSFAGITTQALNTPRAADIAYLAQNPSALAEIAQGTYSSVFDQWVHEGAAHGATYNGHTLQAAEAAYLQDYTDVAGTAGTDSTNFTLQHFLLHGQQEGRSFAGTGQVLPSAARGADALYLADNAAAASEVAAGQYRNGFEQWLHEGAVQGLAYNGYTLASAAASYLQSYTDLQYIPDAAALQHFEQYGAAEGRTLAGIATASLKPVRAADIAYLTAHPTALTEIEQGTYASALDQWIHEGAAQGLTYNGYSLQQAEQQYLQDNPDVAASVNSTGTSTPDMMGGAILHFLNFGENEGRSFAGNTATMSLGEKADVTYLTQNTDVAQAVAAGSYQTGFDHWLRSGAVEGRSYNGKTLQTAGQAYLQANSDVAASVQAELPEQALQHFQQYGIRENRLFAGVDGSVIAQLPNSGGTDDIVAFVRADGSEVFAAPLAANTLSGTANVMALDQSGKLVTLAGPGEQVSVILKNGVRVLMGPKGAVVLPGFDGVDVVRGFAGAATIVGSQNLATLARLQQLTAPIQRLQTADESLYFGGVRPTDPGQTSLSDFTKNVISDAITQNETGTSPKSVYSLVNGVYGASQIDVRKNGPAAVNTLLKILKDGGVTDSGQLFRLEEGLLTGDLSQILPEDLVAANKALKTPEGVAGVKNADYNNLRVRIGYTADLLDDAAGNPFGLGDFSQASPDYYKAVSLVSEIANQVTAAQTVDGKPSFANTLAKFLKGETVVVSSTGIVVEGGEPTYDRLVSLLSKTNQYGAPNPADPNDPESRVLTQGNHLVESANINAAKAQKAAQNAGDGTGPESSAAGIGGRLPQDVDNIEDLNGNGADFPTEYVEPTGVGTEMHAIIDGDTVHVAFLNTAGDLVTNAEGQPVQADLTLPQFQTLLDQGQSFGFTNAIGVIDDAGKLIFKEANPATLGPPHNIGEALGLMLGGLLAGDDAVLGAFTGATGQEVGGIIEQALNGAEWDTLNNLKVDGIELATNAGMALIGAGVCNLLKDANLNDQEKQAISGLVQFAASKVSDVAATLLTDGAANNIANAIAHEMGLTTQFKGISEGIGSGVLTFVQEAFKIGQFIAAGHVTTVSAVEEAASVGLDLWSASLATSGSALLASEDAELAALGTGQIELAAVIAVVNLVVTLFEGLIAGQPAPPSADDQVQVANGRFVAGAASSAHGLDDTFVQAIANSMSDILNATVGATGAAVPQSNNAAFFNAGAGLTIHEEVTKDGLSFDLGGGPSPDPLQAMFTGLRAYINQLRIDGGDPIIIRALANSPAGDINGLEQDVAVAQFYESYLSNQNLFDTASATDKAAGGSVHSAALDMILDYARNTLHLDTPLPQERASNPDLHGLKLGRSEVVLDLDPAQGIHSTKLAAPEAPLVRTELPGVGDNDPREFLSPFKVMGQNSDPAQYGDPNLPTVAGVPAQVGTDGLTHLTATLTPHAGVLVRDINGDGQISGDDLTFDNSTFGNNGLDGLAHEAKVTDGTLTSQDSLWGSLRVWQDLNGDGHADANELSTLDQLGISQINLNPSTETGSYLDGAGMNVVKTSSFVRNGQTSDVQVVRLAYNPADANRQTAVTLPGGTTISVSGPMEGVLVRRDPQILDNGHDTTLDGLLSGTADPDTGFVRARVDTDVLLPSNALWSQLGLLRSDGSVISLNEAGIQEIDLAPSDVFPVAPRAGVAILFETGQLNDGVPIQGVRFAPGSASANA